MSKEILERYIKIADTVFIPSDRIKFLNDILLVIAPFRNLSEVSKSINARLRHLEQQGYSATVSNTSKLTSLQEETDIKALESDARNGRVRVIVRKLEKYFKARGFYLKEIISQLVPHLSNQDFEYIKNWAQSKDIKLVDSKILAAQVKKASNSKDSKRIGQLRRKAFGYIEKSEYASEVAELVSELDKVDFPRKRHFLRKLILAAICKVAGNSYSLSYFVMRCSGCIDQHFIELKRYSYINWKKVVQSSLNLSRSK